MDPGAEHHALGPHLIDAPIDEVLFHLEVGDPVTEEPADAVVALEDGDVVTLARELLRGREPRRTRPDDRDSLARLHAGQHRDDEPRLESAVGDAPFDVLDDDRVFVDVEHAGRLAGRRAPVIR